MNSKLFSFDSKNLLRGLIVAIISGIALPVLAVFQTPGFDITQANWGAIGTLALNGAVSGFVAYVTKTFFSDENGKILGKV